MCSPLLPLPALRKTLSGVERTSRSHRKMFAFEPYATLAVHCGNGFDAGFSSIKVSVCAAKMPSPELGGWTMNFGEAVKSGFDNYVTFWAAQRARSFGIGFCFPLLQTWWGHHRRRLRDRSYWCSDILGAAASRGRRLGAAPARS